MPRSGITGSNPILRLLIFMVTFLYEDCNNLQILLRYENAIPHSQPTLNGISF